MLWGGWWVDNALPAEYRGPEGQPKLIHIAEFITHSRVGGGAVRELCGSEEVRAFILDQIPGKRRETGGRT